MTRFSFSFDDDLPRVTDPSDADRPLRILTVCTGNIARSALAEALVRHAGERAGDRIIVSGAGTEAMVDYSATAEMIELAASAGLDLTSHRARQLTEDLIMQSDLVLTATREHRATAARLAPDARARIFTLPEFARTATVTRGDGPRRPFDAAFVDEVIRTRRSLIPLLTPEDDDIVDPYRHPMAVYRAVAVRIASTVSESFGLRSGQAASE